MKEERRSVIDGKREIKRLLHAECRTFLDNQIANLNIALKAAFDSGNSETKSTTGDKHETGRALMQMEQEKIGHQLKELQIVYDKLERIPVELNTDRIVAGNVVITDKGNFYIAIAAGKLKEQENIYFAVSPSSPLGSLFLKSEIGKTVMMNGNSYRLVETF